MLYRCLLGAVVLFVTITSASSASLYPFLIPVRTELVNQISLARTNGSSAEARLLTQARNAIDRRGRATLTGDLQSLNTVATLIGRTGLNDVFDPLLNEATTSYLEVLTDTVATLQTNLNELEGDSRVENAQAALDDVSALLADASEATSIQSASRVLSRAAVRLVAVQTLVNRVSADVNRPQEMTAFVGSDFFSTRNTSALYSAGTGNLTVTGTETSLGRTRSITINLTGVRIGTTVHSFNASGIGSYATYSTRGTNSLGYTSTSGYATVTVDPSARTVTGNFNFTASGGGTFDPPIQVSGGTFFSRLR